MNSWKYRRGVLDEDLGASEGVLGGGHGQVAQESSHAFDGRAAPVGPRQTRRHLETLQEGAVRLPEDESGSSDPAQSGQVQVMHLVARGIIANLKSPFIHRSKSSVCGLSTIMGTILRQ